MSSSWLLYWFNGPLQGHPKTLSASPTIIVEEGIQRSGAFEEWIHGGSKQEQHWNRKTKKAAAHEMLED
eukprot:435490-Ditylum_brightwellii.AAC.1